MCVLNPTARPTSRQTATPIARPLPPRPAPSHALALHLAKLADEEQRKIDMARQRELERLRELARHD